MVGGVQVPGVLEFKNDFSVVQDETSAVLEPCNQAHLLSACWYLLHFILSVSLPPMVSSRRLDHRGLGLLRRRYEQQRVVREDLTPSQFCCTPIRAQGTLTRRHKRSDRRPCIRCIGLAESSMRLAGDMPPSAPAIVNVKR